MDPATPSPPPLPPSPPSVPAQPVAVDQKKLRLELTLFLIFIGVLLAALVGALLLYSEANPSQGPRDPRRQVFGMDINEAAGILLTVVAALFFVTGVVFALFPKKIFIWAGVAWGFLLLGCYGGFLYVATGEVQTNPMTMAIIAVPVLLWYRGSKFKPG